MSQCAELLDNQISMDFLDINVGCPIDIICSKGSGCALLSQPRKVFISIFLFNYYLSSWKILYVVFLR